MWREDTGKWSEGITGAVTNPLRALVYIQID